MKALVRQQNIWPTKEEGYTPILRLGPFWQMYPILDFHRDIVVVRNYYVAQHVCHHTLLITKFQAFKFVKYQYFQITFRSCPVKPIALKKLIFQIHDPSKCEFILCTFFLS